MSPVLLREPLDRPRLLRMTIRGERAPVEGPEVAQGVAARVDGGVFVAGPPLGVFHTVEMWAGAERNAVSVGCVPTRAGATVEIWNLLDAGAVAGAEPGTVEAARSGDHVTLTCRAGPPGAELVVDVLWEDG
jgi:hypothetical protein